MSSPQPKSLTRRIVRIASLGLFGLLAGLLAGCTSTPTPYNTASYSHSSNLPAAPPKSLDATRTPEIKHSPAPHHLQPWPSRYGPMPSVDAGIQSGRTAAEYTFTASAASPQLHGQ